MREDGRCVVCQGERRTANLRPLYREPAKLDPFCSTECARAWYGVTVLSAPRKPAKRGYV